MIHVINLPHRIERRKSAEREFELQNTEVRFWDGIIHQNSRTGICRAHKQIIQYAKETKLPFITIAEDDIQFTSQNSLSYYFEKIPKDFDLYLGCVYSGHVMHNNMISKFTGLILYTISERFYDKFLALPEDKNIDCYLANLGKYFVCNPFVCKQYNGFSDNVKRDVDYDKFIRTRKFLAE